MSNDSKNLTGLFESKTVVVCKPDSPFWMTGGRLAAILMRCQNLLGGEGKAASMLALIETAKDCPLLSYRTVYSGCREAYGENPVYAGIIDAFAAMIRDNPAFEGYTHIAGVEGAGLLLSVLLSGLLEKPHLMIFKSKEIYLHENGRSSRLETLNGAKILFVNDFFAENSSFFKLWLPAVYTLGENKLLAAALFDRHIGGSDRLVESGVYCRALFDINKEFFAAAGELRLITLEQVDFLMRYLDNPQQYMAEFLTQNPDFIKRSAESTDPVIAERAKLCVQRGLYQLS